MERFYRWRICHVHRRPAGKRGRTKHKIALANGERRHRFQSRLANRQRFYQRFPLSVAANPNSSANRNSVTNCDPGAFTISIANSVACIDIRQRFQLCFTRADCDASCESDPTVAPAGPKCNAEFERLRERDDCDRRVR